MARALVGVAKLLHDSLDLLSSHERQRQASSRRARHQSKGVAHTRWSSIIRGGVLVAVRCMYCGNEK